MAIEADKRPPPAEGVRRELTLLQRLPVRRIILILLAISLVTGVALGSWATLRVGRFSGSQWADLVLNGVARGSVYALIAMGYTLVYGILFMINFAHGEVFMAGTFSTLFLARWLDSKGLIASQPVLAIAIMLVFSALISMTVAILLERVAYRPLRGAPRLVPLITAIGASLFLQYTFRGLYGAQVQAYPRIQAVRGTWTLFGYNMAKSQAIVILGAVLLVVALYLVIERTRTGRSMRAVGEDKEVASLMGIDVDKTIVTTFAIGGLLAGAAGILYIFLFNQVDFAMGFVPGIKAFTAAVLGGIGNITGAAMGGLLLGVMEAVGPFLFLTGADVPGINQLQPVVAFGVLVLVLIFRPGGILGSAEEQRA